VGPSAAGTFPGAAVKGLALAISYRDTAALCRSDASAQLQYM
jgi:hypothetical protein